MKVAFALLLLAALTGCDRSLAADGHRAVGDEAQATTPSYDPSIDEDSAAERDRLVILCDPIRFRLSIRHRADAESVDRSYPRRTVIDPETLVERFPNHGGEEQYQGPLIRYELCGPFIVRLQGGFLNANTAGEMGAIEPFATIHVSADNRRLYPDNESGRIRLAPCAERLPIWRECPADYAGRVDLAYRPGAERLSIHEWARIEDLLGGGEPPRTIERRSEVRAMLDLWWGRAHPDAPPDHQY